MGFGKVFLFYFILYSFLNPEGQLHFFYKHIINNDKSLGDLLHCFVQRFFNDGPLCGINLLSIKPAYEHTQHSFYFRNDNGIHILGTDFLMEDSQKVVFREISDGYGQMNLESVFGQHIKFMGNLLYPDIIDIHHIPRKNKMDAFRIHFVNYRSTQKTPV